MRLAPTTMSDLLMSRFWAERCRPSCLDCRQEGLHPDDVHDAGEVVGEHVQGHLGRNLGQALHQKVGCSHPHLERCRSMICELITGPYSSPAPAWSRGRGAFDGRHGAMKPDGRVRERDDMTVGIGGAPRRVQRVASSPVAWPIPSAGGTEPWLLPGWPASSDAPQGNPTRPNPLRKDRQLARRSLTD
jgi:hypothetical protein